MEWVLVLYIYAGVMAKGDSVTVTTIPMESLGACSKAGDALNALVTSSTKNIRSICVRNK